MKSKALNLTFQLVWEWHYRALERLGMMCENRFPSPAIIALAEAEASAWLEEEMVYAAIDAELPL